MSNETPNPMARYVEVFPRRGPPMQREARLAWAGVGSMSAEDARLMAAAILAAADEVDRQNAEGKGAA
jgi:hypothetical protein